MAEEPSVGREVVVGVLRKDFRKFPGPEGARSLPAISKLGSGVILFAFVGVIQEDELGEDSPRDKMVRE